MAVTEPILDLSTLKSSRPPIRIDGVVYHLKSPEELTLLESQQFTDWGKEIEALAADKSKVKALAALVLVVANAAVADVSPAIVEKLSETQRMAIVEVFSGLLLDRRLRPAGMLAKQVINRLIGESSSLASSTSTAAILATGIQSPQPAS